MLSELPSNADPDAGSGGQDAEDDGFCIREDTQFLSGAGPASSMGFEIREDTQFLSLIHI